jgi:lipopolysaccharide transport system ATP-binding protein
MKPIIEARNLNKKYRIGSSQPYYSLRDSISSLMSASFKNGQGKKDKNEFWALKNVSFEINPGEVVGVIGRNGAGKSTLLKLLSQITPPTKGEITLRGRVASLLEVGTGFHPELTGRENIYLNGAILGMTRKEIKQKFDEIVEFAEIETFLDTPVKRYSSGMYMRLAFSIAAHLEPEILLLDEILSVGDTQFQRKCIAKMEEITKVSKRTIIIVSHNMGLIESLCKKVILLENGQIKKIGKPAAVISSYASMNSHIDLKDNKGRQGNGEIKITSVDFRNAAGKLSNSYKFNEDMRIHIKYSSNLEKISDLTVGLSLDSNLGHRICEMSSQSDLDFPKNLPPKGELVCRIPQIPLNAGTYYVTFIIRHKSDITDWLKQAAAFEIKHSTDQKKKNLLLAWGSVAIDHAWSLK